MKKHRQKKKRKIPTLAALLLITLLALLLSTAGVTLAKYVTERNSEATATAVPFYFSSNLLAEERADTTLPYYQLDDTGSESVTISFTLSNSIDALRRTDMDISYSYTVLDNTGIEVEGLAGEGTILSSSTEPIDVNISGVSPNLFADNGVVTVRVKSLSPYSTTLAAKFGFVEDDSTGLHYEVSEEGSAVILTVRGGRGESVTVSYPSSLVPDQTNDILSTAAGNSVTFTAQENTSYALVFLKTDPTLGYLPADFTITASEQAG